MVAALKSRARREKGSRQAAFIILAPSGSLQAPISRSKDSWFVCSALR